MDESNENHPVEEVKSEPPKTRKGRFNLYGIGALLVAVAGIAGLQYFGVVDFKSMSTPGLAINSINSGKAVATVNGEKITEGEVQSRLTQVTNVLKAQGADLSAEGALDEYRSQIIDDLIDNTLLLQAANAAGASTTDEVVDGEFAKLVEMFGGEEALDEQLKVVGMTRDELKANLREQKIIEAYVSSRSDLGNIVVTDAEAKAYFETTTKGAEPGTVPKYEEVADLMKQELTQKKAEEIVQGIVAELKEKATIERA